jgi:hypothetical protein
LEYIREQFKTFELCFAAVQSQGCALEYVPEQFKTFELCLAAVRHDWSATIFVPDDLRNHEICAAAQENSNKVNGTTLPDDYWERESEF